MLQTFFLLFSLPYVDPRTKFCMVLSLVISFGVRTAHVTSSPHGMVMHLLVKLSIIYLFLFVMIVGLPPFLDVGCWSQLFQPLGERLSQYNGKRFSSHHFGFKSSRNLKFSLNTRMTQFLNICGFQFHRARLQEARTLGETKIGHTTL